MGKAKTLTLFKSTKNKVSGGYLSIAWAEVGENGKEYARDDNAFLFSLESKVKVAPANKERAASFMKGAGPRFGGASLSVRKVEMMNSVNGCQCRVNGAKHENYNVPADEMGNSILTGDGKD